ncbi:hypothetical protein DT385_09505 [Pseudomonas syringae]|nr:hypothetical protein DT385_09505 [Pseudomonas syringae]
MLVKGGAEGFSHGVAQSFQNFSATALARNSQHSELEFWSDTAADATLLSSPEVVAHTAGSKALAYLSQQPLSSRRCAVLFDPRSAASLIGHLVQAVSGQALYTSSSFLLDKMGQQVLADHISLREDPFIPGSVSSIAFDGDGIAPQKRHVVEYGELKGYFLSLYAARPLSKEPTGHGLGPSNLLISSTLTQPEDDFTQMLKKLGTGLLVTSLAGNGVRLHNGDYSRGARGFWVANGEIQHAVTGITISSNLAQIFLGIAAIGSDELTQGSFRTGSILIDQMQISGH